MKYTIVGGLPEPSGGVTIFNGDLVELIVARGHSVVVYDQNPGKKQSRFDKIELRVWSGQTKWMFHLWVLFTIVSTNADRYILHTSKISGLLRLLIPLILKKHCSVFFHNGNIINESGFYFAKVLFRWLINLVDKSYVMSASQYDQLRSLGYSVGKIEKIKPVIKPSVARDRNIIPLVDRPLVFMACGHEERCYRYEFIIKFAQGIPDSCVQLYLYGTKTDPAYLTELQLLDVNKCLNIYRNKSREEFITALGMARLFARPNNVDSFGVSVLDALQAGTPVVASDICERPTGAFIFETDNYAAFVNSARNALAQLVAPHPVDDPAAITLSAIDKMLIEDKT
jgi:glycosyltransferase involved in cell wall biosynthesis